MGIKLVLNTILSIVKWVVCTPIIWASKGLALILAPIASLPWFINVDAKGREHLVGAWKWISTHDTPVDAYAYGSLGREHKLLREFDTETPSNNAEWLKYINRVLWIWRNPAYVVADYFGFDQRGMKFLYQRDEGSLWDSGHPNFSFYLAQNSSGSVGWMLEWQWYFYKQRCLEVYLGWKLFRDDPNQRCMMVSRITSKVYEIEQTTL